MNTPSGPVLPVQQPVQAAYRPAYKPHRALVPMLTTGLALMVLLEFLFGVEILYFMGDQGEFLSRVEAGDLAANIIALMMRALDIGWRAVVLLTLVMLLMWVHEANNNARALGAEGMNYTPGWSVGWFFIPLANLLVPHYVITEIYKASDPASSGEEWKKTLEPLTVKCWWLLWVVSNGLTQVSILYDLHSTEGGDKIRLANVPIGILAAGLAILLVRGVHSRQEEKFARLQGHDQDHGLKP